MLPIMISDGPLAQRDAWRYALDLSDLTLIDERGKKSGERGTFFAAQPGSTSWSSMS